MNFNYRYLCVRHAKHWLNNLIRVSPSNYWLIRIEFKIYLWEQRGWRSKSSVRDIEKQNLHDYANHNFPNVYAGLTPSQCFFLEEENCEGKSLLYFTAPRLSLCVRGWFRCVGYKRTIAVSSNRYFSCELRSNLKKRISFREFLLSELKLSQTYW